MTIKNFVLKYTGENVKDKKISIGQTSLRGFIKINKRVLEEYKIVKIIKKLKSEQVIILEPMRLYNILTQEDRLVKVIF
jgi:hypothetical protein